MLGIGAVILPIVVTQSSRHLLYTTILVFALCGMSLTVLTGWAGQLSLGQMAFAGIGAMLTATFIRGLSLNIGWGDTRILKAGIEPLPTGPAIILAVLITAGLAALVGLTALRAQGLMLAVSTFAFGLAASQYMYQRPILNGGFGRSVPMLRTTLFGLDITEQKTFYYVVLGVLAVVTLIIARLRRTGVGRTTIGVRDNPAGASAYTIKAARVKLSTFALSGGIAALGGAMLGLALQNIPLDRFFTVQDSLILVSIVVIGGLGSVVGPILGALWVIGLPAFFPGNEIVPLLSSSVGLLILLLYFPGGLVQLGYGARDALFEWMAKRVGPVPATPSLHDVDLAEPPGTCAARRRRAGAAHVRRVGQLRRHPCGRPRVDRGRRRRDRRPDRHERRRQVDADECDRWLLPQHRPGGAWAASTCRTSRPPRGRGPGLGRTFQSATLFPELTVRETVQLALEGRHRTGSAVVGAVPAPVRSALERVRRTDADDLIDFLGLGRYAEAYIADLSTGTRRIVELAGLLALDAKLLCLDEPTAGLAQRETEAAGPLIQEISRELHASVLVIEHDMPLIMGISDRVYCLDLGRVIAHGVPERGAQQPRRHRQLPRHRRTRHRTQRPCHRPRLNPYRLAVASVAIAAAPADDEADEDEGHEDPDARHDDLTDAVEVRVEEGVGIPVGERTADHRVDEPDRREDQPRRRLGERRADR